MIDDEESVRTVARAALEEAGFRVLTAGDGREAVEMYRERAAEVDAVLLDLIMPRMSGHETLDAMRRIRTDVRVVLTSGHGEKEIAQKLTNRGVTSFLQKPYRPRALVERIEKALTSLRV